MATPTDLRDSLQKISALMGLLRSDLLELAETRGKTRRGAVVDHIHWIADQLEEAGDGLSDNRDRPAVKRRAASAKRPAAKSSSRLSTARGPAHPATSHASSRRAPVHGAHHDSARPARRRPDAPHGATQTPPPAVDAAKPASGVAEDAIIRNEASAPKPESLSRPETPTTPKLPDLPEMPGDDKLH